MNAENLHIVLGVHNKNNYFIHSLATLNSCLSKSGSKITPHIFHDHTLCKGEMAHFHKLAKRYATTAIFHDLTEEINNFPRLEAWKNFSPGCMFRLFIPQELPGQTAVYLDSDTIVNTDIANFLAPWLSSRTNAVWAVNDAFASQKIFTPHLRELGISPDRYFNSGVLIFHGDILAGIYPDFTSEIYAVAQNESNLLFPDQDILNILATRKPIAGFMPSKTNFQTGYGKRCNLGPELLNDRIIHYTWHKPWDKIFPAGMCYWHEIEKIGPLL